MSSTKSTSPNSFSRIAIAHVEGTARSVRHRQQQFLHLQQALLKHKADLIQALRDDYSFSANEALIEYSLTLSELRHHYDGLSLAKEVQAAKAIENANESLTRSVGVGIVYIVPRSGVHAVLAPLCAALAAGNCIIVEIPQTTNRTSSALRNILLSSLSLDTFGIAKERPDAEFLRQCTVVLQTDEVLNSSSQAASDLHSSKGLIRSPSSAWNFAFVDRGANLKLAAKSLIVAKFGFGNSSSYSPYVVFVHEAVAKSFSAMLVDHANSSFGGLSSFTQGQRASSTEKDIASLTSTKGTKVLLSGQRGAIIDVFDRPEQVLSSYSKLSSHASIMLLCRYTSTDEAIDIATELAAGDKGGKYRSTNPAAAFIFAAPADAQYLANNIEASITCVNTFPAELLVGPKLPVSDRLVEGKASLSPRYNRQLFEESRPSIQSASSLSQLVDDGASLVAQNENRKLRQWAESVEVALQPTGQKPGNKVGFFDAAIMLGAATAGLPILIGLGYLGSLAFRRYGGGRIGFPW